jgi:hypothetical protein
MQQSRLITDLIFALRTFVSDGRRLAVTKKFMDRVAADWCKEIMKPNFVFRAKDHGV